MKRTKIILSFVILITLCDISIAQDYSRFASEYNNLKYRYKSVFNESVNLYDLQENGTYVYNEVRNLLEEIEQSDEYSNPQKGNDIFKLYSELKDFEGFINFDNMSGSCESLNNLNNIISGLGGYSKLQKESNGVKVYSADIGNFRLFYIYSQENYTYAIKAYRYGNMESGTSQFNIVGSIKIFNVSLKKNNVRITKLIATKKN